MDKNYRNFLYSKYKSFKRLEDLDPSKRREDPALNLLYKKHLPESVDSTILEIGCGNGFFLSWLEGLGYKNISGVDLDSAHVEFAKKAGLEDVHTDDCKDFLSQQNKDKYDLIVALDLFEHLTKDEIIELLDLVKSRLKNDGKLLIRIPNAESPFSRIYQHGDLTHETALNRFSLKQLSTALEFSDVAFKGVPDRFAPSFKLRPYYLKQYLAYLIHKLSLTFIKRFVVYDQNAILTKNLIAIFSK